MAVQVNGKTALVTGAGSGICTAFTKLLLENNCNVVIADLALTPEAEEVVDRKIEVGVARAVFKKTDVVDWVQLQAVFDFAIEEFGHLDIVCPGAGIFEPVSLGPVCQGYTKKWLTGDCRSGRASGILTQESTLLHPLLIRLWIST